MQDVQNMPNPDVNSTVEEGDFGNHSDIENIENDNGGTNSDTDSIPLPPDEQQPAPIEEPPETEKPPIGEDNPQPAQLV